LNLRNNYGVLGIRGIIIKLEILRGIWKLPGEKTERRTIRMAKKYLFFLLKGLLILFFISIFAVGCKIDLKFQNEKSPIVQDLALLIDSDGMITSQEPISLSGPWAEKVQSFRITYLSDYLKVVGFLMKPKKEGLRYPVVIYNRGGYREFGKIGTGHLEELARFPGNDYVLLASQYRGNDSGEGKEDFGGSDVNDVLNLIKLARSLPFADPNKVFMYGFSRGGMMTYLSIKHGAGIKAAAVVGGLTDIKETYESREEAKKRVFQEILGMDQNEWEKKSAVCWPDRINVPTLILHGENDDEVSLNQARRLAEGLRKAGKTYELLIFPGGNHPLSSHANERNRKIFEWFKKYQ
jgi:dienelactone hydrolase